MVKGKPKNATGKGARQNKENKQQWRNHSHIQFLRAFLDLALIETPIRSPHLDHEGWLKWTHDTSAGISAFPLDARIGTETQANDSAYKERLTMERFSHKTPISASNVHNKGHDAVVDWNGGDIIFCNNMFTRKIQQIVQQEIVKEPGEYVCHWRMAHIGCSKIQSAERVKSCVRCMRNKSLEAFGATERCKSDGYPLRNRQNQICKSCPFKTRLWTKALLSGTRW